MKYKVFLYTFIGFFMTNFFIVSSLKAEVSGFDKEIFIESAKEEKILRIGLVDCIAYALKNNSEIRIANIEPKIKQDDIKIAEAVFEPVLTLNVSYDDSEQQLSTSTPVSTSEKTDFNADIKGKLIIGTEYGISFNNTKYKSNSDLQIINPYYQSKTAITITQPLLKKAGIFVNKADIIIAQNNKNRSLKEFKNEAIKVISETKKAYFNYIYFIKQYEITELLLDWTQQLYDITKVRYDKGLVSSVDLLEIGSAVAERKKELIACESNLRNSEDELKLITNLVDDSELWNASIMPIDQPKFSVKKVDLVESLKNAFQYRPDYISKNIELQNKDIKIKVAKNSLYPAVNLVGSFGLNGLDDTYNRALDNMDDSNYRDWGVGVEVTIPWGKGNRADFDKKKLEKAQALLELKRLEQSIILEVRDKVRSIDIQYRQVEAAKLLKEKQQKNYKAQERRYKAGELNTHDFLDYRVQLALAELEYIKALIDYNIAFIELDRAQGLTLVNNDIILEN